MSDQQVPLEGADNRPSLVGLQAVLRLAIENTDTDNPTSQEELDAEEARDPARRLWLREALAHMCTDLHEEMRRGIKNLKELMEKFGNEGKLSENDYRLTERTCDTLVEIVSGIDFAQDFVKMGGYEELKKMIESNDDRLMVKACEVLAETLQFSSFCQEACVEKGFLTLLVQILNSEAEEEPQAKALYSLSCLLRANKEIQKVFDQEYDGFALMLRLLEKPTKSNKLCIKTAFLLTDLCLQQPEIRDTLCKMGFVTKLVSLLHTNHDSSHEHLLSSLCAMVNKHEASKKKCQDASLKLQELLQNKIAQLSGKEEFLEEVNYSKTLLKTCFSQSA